MFRGEVLVVGAGGMLGTAWCKLLMANGISFLKADLPGFDATDEESVRRKIGAELACVINCAAWTDAESAELDEERAMRINADSARLLAEQCARTGTVLVHYSTDYVFNGLSSTPYLPESAVCPINAYGRSKALGEKHVQQSTVEHLLVRTSWLYAPWGDNFVNTISSLAKSRSHLRVVDDQRGRPTSAYRLADASWNLFRRGCRGTFHVCDDGECSWFEFAKTIVELEGSPCEVQPCSTEQHGGRTRRPPYSVLDLEKTVAEIGPLTHWRANLADVIAERKQAEV